MTPPRPDTSDTGKTDVVWPAIFVTAGRWLRAVVDLLTVDTHPACPICGRVYYVKTMPLHLGGHHPDDPDVVAWRERGAPSMWRAAE